ncbi:MscS mechanosensitive ion channel [Flammeovirgaceae bacterium 311]|nr:MscS mechanosensitive ion channel [Flammeovirgaceae bacterium 311]
MATGTRTNNNSNNSSYGTRRSNTRVANRSRAAARRGVSTRRNVQQRGRAVKGAQNQLKKFRQGSILAVAITSFLLILFSPEESGYSQDLESTPETELAEGSETPSEAGFLAQATDEPETEADTADTIAEEEAEQELEEEQTDNEPITRAARDEALGAFQGLWNNFKSHLPKILVGVLILLLAWLLAQFFKWFLPKILGKWERANATITLLNICVWLFAIGMAISVLVGDISAMVASLGLIGLALSWSLQTPIESFTGWLFNSFKGYYRPGDRISVGDVVGDVYKIDFLTTTVWEIGSPRQGYLQAEQPTGRLVTFPNNEVLAGSVVNYTNDFPYVWDELNVAIANESNIRLAMEVLQKVAENLLGNYMHKPAMEYSRILQRAGLPSEVADKPQIFLSLDDSWTNVIIRYLVGARERRKWKTELIALTAEELGKPEYRGKIIAVYPRQQLQLLDMAGKPIMPVNHNNQPNE